MIAVIQFPAPAGVRSILSHCWTWMSIENVGLKINFWAICLMLINYRNRLSITEYTKGRVLKWPVMHVRVSALVFSNTARVDVGTQSTRSDPEDVIDISRPNNISCPLAACRNTLPAVSNKQFMHCRWTSCTGGTGIDDQFVIRYGPEKNIPSFFRATKKLQTFATISNL